MRNNRNRGGATGGQACPPCKKKIWIFVTYVDAGASQKREYDVQKGNDPNRFFPSITKSRFTSTDKISQIPKQDYAMYPVPR